MWLAILDQDSEFEALSKSFLKMERKLYENQETPFGTRLLVLKEDTNKALPSFLLLDKDPSGHRDAFRWVYKNLPIDTFVSTGVLEQSSLSTPEETSVFLPRLGLRSHGRLDFHSGPILYEEMLFDEATHRLLLNLLSPLGLPVITERPLFAANKPIKVEELYKVIENDLQSPGWDYFSSELMLFARHFSVKCACLKICKPKNNLKDLTQLWMDLIQVRLSEPAKSP
jgi:hypothetical protein